MSPKRHICALTQESANVTLFGERVFTDVTKMRTSRRDDPRSRVALTLITDVLRNRRGAHAGEAM